MAGKFCVNLTHAHDNPDKATVGFVIANAAVGSGKETLVFLSVEGVRLATKGAADTIREEGFAPLRELMDNFAKAGGTIYVCSPCFKKRKLDENNLVAGAAIVGGAKLVEFLSDGSPCVSSSARTDPAPRRGMPRRRDFSRPSRRFDPRAT
jgi:predicted peroxiredoxin